MPHYVAEIRAFGDGDLPRDFLPCDGRELSINSYLPLYALIGTTYGGDGSPSSRSRTSAAESSPGPRPSTAALDAGERSRRQGPGRDSLDGGALGYLGGRHLPAEGLTAQSGRERRYIGPAVDTRAA